MRVARVVMDLGVSAGELRERQRYFEPLVPRGYAKGTAHREFVRNMFRADREAYLARLATIVEEARKRKAGVVILPAISILHDGSVTLRRYRRVFGGVRHVVGGVLDASRLGHKRDEREGTLVFRDGHQSDFPTNRYAMDLSAGFLGQRPAIVAVSSTVEHVRDAGWLDNAGIPHRRPVLVCDLGHEQYTGHYGRKLASVLQRVCDGVHPESVVVLSWWRYARSSSSASWLFPSSIGFVRETVVAGDFVDALDIADVPD